MPARWRRPRIKTTVEHPDEQGAVHEHNSLKVNFGCSEPWLVAGQDGTASPFMSLQPATPGVLVKASQTTSGMGVYPNDAGHKCISDLISEAETPEPGTTPLKCRADIFRLDSRRGRRYCTERSV